MNRRYVQRERARTTARTSSAIESAALREVSRRGYAKLRVSEVARRAHVAPRTVYLHAQTKERLVDAALRGLKRGKSHVISGWTNFFMIETERLVPRLLILRVAGAVLRNAVGSKQSSGTGQ